jgi:DNA ligase-1
VKRFAELYDAIDRTTSTNAKVDALARYLGDAPPADAAWALYFLTGRRLKRLLPTRLMHEWTLELTALPEWLVSESYSVAGDFAEAIALLLEGRVEPIPADLLRRPRQAEPGLLPFGDPDPVPIDVDVQDISLAAWIERRILPLRDLDEQEKRVRVIAWWSRLERRELFLLNKLLTGEFRVGVSHTLVVRALAQRAGLAPAVVEHRLMGNWQPSAAVFRSFVAPESPEDQPSRPYPFCLASPLEGTVEGLGDRAEWLVEWKWDGIRAQLIHRAGQVFLWSRGEELITDRFPEVSGSARALPAGTVLDGEVLAFGDGTPRPFADLQRRIGRQKKVSEIAGDVPVVFVAYDLLEEHGTDIRALPMRERRARLAALIEQHLALAGAAGHVTADGPGDGPAGSTGEAAPAIAISEAITADSWATLAVLRDQSRARQVEGLMLKRWSSSYRPGRKRGDWWKWKVEPYTVDAVLIYAQPGSGRRATLFTDLTFGLWCDGQLVPVAKAYSGLSDEEIDELDRWVRRHTLERFGPVSAVEPVHVFELGFERIARSTRHKSGVAVRFPRMLRWRKDKAPKDADTLETLEQMIEGAE